MKLTKRRLKQIIKEEIRNVVNEDKWIDRVPERDGGVRDLINPSRDLVPQWVDHAHDIWIRSAGGDDSWRGKDSNSFAQKWAWWIIDSTEAGKQFAGDVTRLASESKMITTWLARKLCKEFGPDDIDCYNDIN